jgi:methylglyoxal synthase
VIFWRKRYSKSFADCHISPKLEDFNLNAFFASFQTEIPDMPQAHDVDVKALLRIAVVYNIPIACNRATADFIISSPLMNQVYQRALNDYSRWLDREFSA